MAAAVKRKVLAYLLRQQGDRTELLVFDHVDAPEAGTQVPAGTAEAEEPLAEAVLREAREESGLTDLRVTRYVGEFLHCNAHRREWQQRHVFVLQAQQPVPETWLHRVCGAGDDRGLLFRYRWVDAQAAIHLLAGHQGAYLAQALDTL